MNYQLKCYSNVNGVNWSVEGISGVSVENDLIVFKDVDEEGKLKITATKENENNSLAIKLTKKEIEYEDGIYITINDLQTTVCDEINDGVPLYHHYSNVFENFTKLDKREDWENQGGFKFDGIITTINGTMDGYINITEKNSYSFSLRKGDYWKVIMRIDDEIFINKWNYCGNEETIKSDIKLDEGLHHVVIDYFVGVKDFETDIIDYSFELKWKELGSEEYVDIPFICCIYFIIFR